MRHRERTLRCRVVSLLPAFRVFWFGPYARYWCVFPRVNFVRGVCGALGWRVFRLCAFYSVITHFVGRSCSCRLTLCKRGWWPLRVVLWVASFVLVDSRSAHLLLLLRPPIFGPSFPLVRCAPYFRQPSRNQQHIHRLPPPLASFSLPFAGCCHLPLPAFPGSRFLQFTASRHRGALVGSRLLLWARPLRPPTSTALHFRRSPIVCATHTSNLHQLTKTDWCCIQHTNTHTKNELMGWQTTTATN